MCHCLRIIVEDVSHDFYRVKVVKVSPGVNETEATSAFLNDLAKTAGILVDETRQNFLYISGAKYHIDSGNFPVIR